MPRHRKSPPCVRPGFPSGPRFVFRAIHLRETRRLHLGYPRAVLRSCSIRTACASESFVPCLVPWSTSCTPSCPFEPNARMYAHAANSWRFTLSIALLDGKTLHLETTSWPYIRPPQPRHRFSKSAPYNDKCKLEGFPSFTCLLHSRIRCLGIVNPLLV